MTTRAGLSVLAVVAAVAVAGCGEGGFASRSADDILAEAQDAMRELESTHVEADIPFAGARAQLALALDAGGSCTATLEFGQGTMQVRALDGDTWIRTDRAMAEAVTGDLVPTTTPQRAGRWLPVEAGATEIAELCDLDGFVAALVDVDAGDLRHAGRETVDGQEAVHLTTGTRPQTSSVFVATQPPHRVLRVSATGDVPLEAEFSRFDEPVEVVAPPTG